VFLSQKLLFPEPEYPQANRQPIQVSQIFSALSKIYLEISL